MPVVALLPRGRLSQGAQSMPGLQLKKHNAALPLVLPGRSTCLVMAGPVTVCRERRPSGPGPVPYLSVGQSPSAQFDRKWHCLLRSVSVVQKRDVLWSGIFRVVAFQQEKRGGDARTGFFFARTVTLLLAARADGNATNDSGDNPLHIACRGCKVAIGASLLAAGVATVVGCHSLQITNTDSSSASRRK